MQRPKDEYGMQCFRDVPLAYWRLDETAGTVVPDVMDNYWGSHTANEPIVGQAPMILSGKSVTYTGTGQTTTTTLGGLGTILPTCAFECLVRTPDTFGPMTMFGTVNLNDQMLLSAYINSADEIQTPGSLEFVVRDADGNSFRANTGDIAINDGLPHHVVWAMQSTSAVDCWVDGVQRAVTYTLNGTLARLTNFEYPMMLGARNVRGTPDRPLIGTLDEVAIYAFGLTGPRIQAHHGARTKVSRVGTNPIRSIYLQAAGDGDKLAWIAYGGPATDWQAVSKNVVPGVDTPNGVNGITTPPAGTGFEHIAMEHLAGKLLPGEHVAYLRPWAYLKANNGTVNLGTVHPGRPASVGAKPVTGVGWKAGYRQSPFSDTTKVLVSDDPGVVELNVTTPALVDCSAVILEVGVSAMEHLVPSGNQMVGAKTRVPFKGTFAQYGSLAFDTFLASDNWDGVRDVFREMRLRGLDMVRLFVQFGFMMSNQLQVNEYVWTKLERGLGIADEEGIRVDITGLQTFDPSDTDYVPSWLDALTEGNRWATFAFWWQRCARAAAGHPCVVAYDLINEPMTKNTGTGLWYDQATPWAFATYICKSLSGRTEAQVADQFRDQLVGDNSHGLRSGDPVKPYSFGIFYTGSIPNFANGTCVLMHYYPQVNQTPAAISANDVYLAPRNVPMFMEESSAHVARDGWLEILCLWMYLRHAGYTAGGPNWKGAFDTFDVKASLGGPTGPNPDMMIWRMSAYIFGRYCKEDERLAAVRPISGRIGQRFT